ncbi:phage portal protein [Enterococcus durans]|uniref:phage portal protein n=1 Tax=Enterococcus durans TaxID=53345 RepID=UPI0010206FB4|nr:phage portal protein [Enterococcus durans]MZG90688.1 phage portal protein [Enterococcus durans]MZG93516.1 phage portal protein [Enterococcus durans]MZH20429.1 phage portal protein [Enterococcus durans]MZH23140.1 phage portal protein [Enterococcus durans]MZH25883.1 phage portal protein [Enterococcus durans]
MEQNIQLLGQQRFDEEANLVYKVPVSQLPKIDMLDQQTGEVSEFIDFNHEDMWKMIVGFIKHHRERQVPRLKELKRYLNADNNIKRRPNKPDGRADNRIASDFANFIVSFKQGVLLGNPISYNGDKVIVERINRFASESNEDYHNQLMSRDAFGLGRAYEWVGRDEYGKETIAKFDAEQTFVIYDNTKDRNSICGVHYFVEKFLDKSFTRIELYTNCGYNYYFTAKDDDLENAVLDEDGEVQSYFDTVQINEWINNEERTSDFEHVMDSIDAYDLSRSEMANFQQDSSEAYLVIKGNPDTADDQEGDNSKLAVFQAMMQARMLVLGDKKIYDNNVAGAEPDAYYLKKEYDVAGMEANDSRTVADILRFTSLIDFTDENIGSNQSGIGFRFKGWGSDNDRKNKERMVKKAIMRRLRLLTHSWSIKDELNKPQGLIDTVKAFFVSDEKQQEQLYNKVNEIQIQFTPNVPQSDEEIMSVIAGMVGIVSDQTLCEMAERLTGVPFKEELKRLKKQAGSGVFDSDKETDTEVEEDESQRADDEPASEKG